MANVFKSFTVDGITSETGFGAVASSKVQVVIHWGQNKTINLM